MERMRFNVEFNEEARDQFKDIPKEFQQLIKRAIEERLETDPISYGKPLRKSWKGHRTLRVSRYRVIYRVIEVKNNVLVVRIEIRRDVYEE
jgi:mRNA interferase RelE/StbE